MTIKEKRSIYEHAINKWGLQAQLFMVMEEVGELLNALAKVNRNRSTKDEIITELADVSIMVEQMANFFGWNDYCKERERKLIRLEKRLG